MTTYDDIKSRVRRLLNDPNGRTHGDSIVYDSVVAAHTAILPWVPKAATATLSSGSEGVLLTLPTDLYIIQALQKVSTGEFIPRATLAPKSVRSAEGTTVDWIDYPFGNISLSIPFEEGTEFKLYYFTYWNVPSSGSDGNFTIEVPVMAQQGLIYWAASNCLLPQAVNSANIRQFNLRVDSGTPEDNPLKVESDRLLRLFYDYMKLMPAYLKVNV